ncbi:ABC transporter permease [Thermotoga sp. KOL6]|uniref:ABC transporter permease n=1 Tax=Thermotoga sp. KOL6 TaxID=126741 RepID=UPI000C77FDB6|nr:ABC transporter permease [Thermotoga sp. KOL6]PLV59261.1 ABC transporter [Thermotoga sp. KOL6]
MFGKLLKKEIKELLSVGTLISVLIISILYGSLGNIFKSTIKETAKKPKIAIVDEDGGKFAKIVKQELESLTDVVYIGSNSNEVEKILKEKKVSAVLVLPKGFSENLENLKHSQIEVFWYLKGTGISDTVSTGIISSLLETLKPKIAEIFLGDKRKVNFLFAPFVVVQHTYLKNLFFQNTSPVSIMNMFYSQSIMIPLLIMMLIIMSGSSLISSLALEKENKTLETLLTMPIKREYIVLAKIVGSTIVGLILAGIYMIGFYNYINSFSQGIEGVGIRFGVFDLVLIGTSLFLAIFVGLSLCILLGIMAKDTKSAQLLTFPISILALIPMMANMIRDFHNLPNALKVVIFAIPFSHPIMAPKLTLYGDYDLLVWGIIYLAVFSTIITSFAFKLFGSDYVILGWQRSEKRRLFLH